MDSRPEVQSVDSPVAGLDNAKWLARGLQEPGARERVLLRWRLVELLSQREIDRRVGVSQIDRVCARIESSSAAA